MTIDWTAIALAAFAAWMFAMAWDGAVLRRRASLLVMIVTLAAVFVMALVLAGVIAHTAKKGVTVYAGVLVSAICWLGFVVTALAANDAGRGAKASQTAFDSARWLGLLLIQGAVLGALL